MPRYSSEPEKVVLADPKPSDCIRRGSARVVGSMMLLKSNQEMHAPFTQVSLNFVRLLIIVTFFKLFFLFFWLL